MPHKLNCICQKEFETRLTCCQPIKNLVAFDNQGTAFVEVEYLIDRFCSTTAKTCGVISMSEHTPPWLVTPDLIDQQQSSSSSVYKFSANTLSGLGYSSGITEYNAGKTTLRFSKQGKFSPKLYPSGWRGGSRVRIKTYKITTLAKGIGRKVFFIGVLVDGIGLANGSISLQKALLNTGISAVATFGGPIGLTIGLIYWGLDSLGAFDRGYGSGIETNREIAPIDNLRVVRPSLIIPER